MNLTPLNILIIEDEFIIAKDLLICFQNRPDYTPTAVKTPAEAKNVFASKNFDIILSDINLNCEIDGIDLVSELINTKPTPVVFLTAYSDPITIQKAAGVFPFAYLLKPFNTNQLLLTIQLAIHNYSKSKDKSFRSNPDNTKLLALLTKREKEILIIHSNGKLVKEIATELSISNRTVEKHIENIKKKLNLNTSGELIHFIMTTEIETLSDVS